MRQRITSGRQAGQSRDLRSNSRSLDGYCCATYAIRWDYVTLFSMTQSSLPTPHEQRKIEQLLIALAKKRPVSAKAAPITYGQSATGTAKPRVFFST